MKKEVAIIGAGKIGKGYVADLFNDAGYRIVFLCHSLRQAKALRDQGYYTVYKYLGSEKEPIEYRIEGFDAFSTAEEFEDSVDALSKVNYATIQVYPDALPDIAKLLAETARKKYREGDTETLDIIVCMNFIGSEKLLKKYVSEILSPEEMEYFNRYFGMGMALTFRLGARPLPYMTENDPLCSCVAESPDLPVDRDAFKGEIPEGVALRPLSKMDERIVYKLWCGNVNHACMAYLGKTKGYTYISEANEDDEVYFSARRAWKEAEFGFDQIYTLTDDEKAETFGSMRRGKNNSHHSRKNQRQAVDWLDRIGADPKRKLARGDRIVGPAISCMKHGMVPFFLAKAAAAGFLFYNPEDVSAGEVQEYLKENGIEKAVEKYCELDTEVQEERMLRDLIVDQYHDLRPEIDSEDL